MSKQQRKRILSAGEISAYVVCPEAWRLQALERVKNSKNASMREGKLLHKLWAKQYEEVIYFGQRVRFVLTLVIVAILIYTMEW